MQVGGDRLVLSPSDLNHHVESAHLTTLARWLVNALLIDPDVARLSPRLLEDRVRPHGFEDVRHVEVIPGITRALIAARPRVS